MLHNVRILCAYNDNNDNNQRMVEALNYVGFCVFKPDEGIPPCYLDSRRSNCFYLTFNVYHYLTFFICYILILPIPADGSFQIFNQACGNFRFFF